MIERRDLADKTLDELADWKASVSPGSPNDQAVNAEFTRRQTVLQVEATQAAKDAATYTKRNARYMLASVVVLASSAAATAIITGLQWREAHNQLQFSAKPLVDFEIEDDPGEPPVGIAMENNGPGPAIIQSVTYYVNGQSTQHSEYAMKLGNVTADLISSFSYDEGDVLGSAKVFWLFRSRKKSEDNQRELNRIIDFMNNNLNVKVRYCSARDDCWTKCSAKSGCPGGSPHPDVPSHPP